MDKDHLEIILESIGNKLDLIIAGQASLGRQLDDWIREAQAKVTHATTQREPS